MWLGLCRVPLYYEGKVLFVLWLWHPKTRGAAYLYQHTLQVAIIPRSQKFRLLWPLHMPPHMSTK